MKRLNDSPDSLLSLISMSSSSPTGEMHFTEDIQTMLDSLDGDDNNEMEIHPTMGKKRRLSLIQVCALEKHFEVDNKLEPDRKAKLAMELGLQPRQVAVWFQNRRARLKNKQLEREYEVLKSSYEELKLSYQNVGREKEALNAQLRDLKLKLTEASESDNRNNIVSADPEPTVDYRLHQTWSSSSSSLMQLYGSMSYLPEDDLSWFQCGNGTAVAEGCPAGPSWFNFEVDYLTNNKV